MQDGYITASFNALNQPVAMWSPALRSSTFMWFGYDPLGRCVKRWIGTVAATAPDTTPATFFYYDGWNLVQEGPNAVAVDRTYVHGNRVDEIVASRVSGAWYYHHYDARGHCIMLTNANGGLQEQYDYDAFGYPRFYTAAGMKLGTPHTRFLFTGREWLSDLRIYDFRARQYQPELGRFLKPDPKEFAAGDYNLYRYCHNDPVNKSDPFGLVDLSYTPDQTRFAAQLNWEPTYNPRDTFTIAGHADANGIMNAAGNYIRLDKIVADITGNKNFDPSKPITLIACEAGKGDNPFGQRLAQALADKTGEKIRVIAPTTEVAPGVKPGDGPQILPQLRPDAAQRHGDDRYDKSKPGQGVRFTAKPRKRDE
jgi:RHS repeat-associated protein